MRANSPSRDPNAPYSSFSTESPSRKGYQRGLGDDTPMNIYPVGSSNRVSYIKYIIAVSTFVCFSVIVTVMVRSSTSENKNNLTTGGSSDIFGAVAVPTFVGGWIYDVAGTGTPGYNGDDIDGTLAELNYPVAVVIDEEINGKPENSVYIADTRNNRIRYMSGLDTTISAFCGTGNAGYSGDDGPAESAELSGPEGVALDNSGNLYIADTGNQMIRMVKSSDKKIYLIAGTGTKGYSGDDGPATSATFYNPIGLAVDIANNNDIFVADSLNHVVRRIDGKTLIITTFAGTGTQGYSGDNGPATAATLNHPRGLFLETYQATTYPSVYVADSENHVIRKITRTSNAQGTISTFIGTGVGGYNGDGLLTTKTQLYRPEDITVDDYGTYYVSDSQNYRIRAFSASDSLVYTYAGTGSVGTTVPNPSGVSATLFSFGQPRGLSIDSDNDLIIVDEYIHAVYSIEKTPTTAPTNAPVLPTKAPTKAPTGAPVKTGAPIKSSLAPTAK